MHLQKVIEALSGLSSLTGGGVEGNSPLNLSAGVSGLGKTRFRGRDIRSCVDCESQIILKDYYSEVIKC